MIVFVVFPVAVCWLTAERQAGGGGKEQPLLYSTLCCCRQADDDDDAVSGVKVSRQRASSRGQSVS